MFAKSFSTLIVAALAVTQLASAHPHGLKRRHVEKREVVTVVTTAATVYVDQYGATVDPKNPPPPVIVTVTAGAGNGAAPAPPAATPTPEPKPSTAPAPAPEEPAPAPEQPAPAPQQPAPAPSSKKPKPAPSSSTPPAPPAKSSPAPAPKEPAPSASASPKRPAGNKPGITYSPWLPNGEPLGRTCKDAETIKSEIAKIKEFSPIRLYDTECDVIQTILSTTSAQIFAGVDGVGDAEGQIKGVIDAVGGQWDRVHTVALGNEHLEFGRFAGGVGEYVTKLTAARTALKAAGYSGPLVAVETVNAWGANKELCAVTDYIATNAHPYFAAQDPNNVESWMKEELNLVKKKVSGSCDKPIHFVESGWPSQGGANALAVPSVENQKIAIRNIVKAMGSDVILFSAYDETWKEDTAATKNTERHWGIKDLTLS